MNSSASADIEGVVKLVDLECTHLASVDGPNGSRHHILMDPTRETVKAVYRWEESGQACGISVSDRTGLHTREVAARVLKIVYSCECMCITTNR